METLAKLRPVFLKDGTVTAGNASGISDGGAANIVMSEEAVKKYGVKPLARVAGYAWSACAPETMGLGPVASCQMALKRWVSDRAGDHDLPRLREVFNSRSAGKTMADMDLIDVNEAFAAQWLAVQKELDLPSEKSNLFGE
jgi:acetyl-CoA acyltransferase 2